MAEEQQSFARWLVSYFVTTEHFKNTAALMMISTYCIMMITGRPIPNEFYILIGVILSFYFKRKED